MNKKIVRLSAQNVKKLKAVEVEIGPDGNLIMVAGRNAQGKSSLMDSIEMGLSGKRSFPKRPVRTGEDEARIEIVIDDFVVRRVIDQDGTTSLIVKSVDGRQKFSSPQQMLDALTKRIGFDPLAWLRKTPKEQVDDLRKIVGIDFTELNAKKARLEMERHAAGRDVSSRKAQIASMPEYPEAGYNRWTAKVVESTEIAERLAKAHAHNRQNDEKRQAVREAAGRFQQALDAKTEGIAQIEEARKSLGEWMQALKEAQRAVDDWKAELSARESQALALGGRAIEAEAELTRISADPLEDVDTDAIEAEMRVVDEKNRELQRIADLRNDEVAANLARKQLEEQFAVKNAAYLELDAEIESIFQTKQSLLADAKWPVPGLSFDQGEDGVLLNEIPFDQSSSSDQLKTALKICLAMNPELPVILIRDGSLLDDDSLRIVAEAAKDADAQVWIETVGTDKTGFADVAVIIEDGSVVAHK